MPAWPRCRECGLEMRPAARKVDGRPVVVMVCDRCGQVER